MADSNQSYISGDSQNPNNAFFNSNAIKPLKRSASQSSQQFAQTARTNITSTNTKLDPKKFMHREVFNTQLYQTTRPGPYKSNQKEMKKFFQISLGKRERETGRLGDEQGVYLKEIDELLKGKNFLDREQFQKPWVTFHHHLSILENLLRYVQEKDPIKSTIVIILQNLQTFLLRTESEITKQDKIIKEFNLNLNGIKRNKIQSLYDDNQGQNVEELQFSTFSKTGMLNDHNKHLSHLSHASNFSTLKNISAETNKKLLASKLREQNQHQPDNSGYAMKKMTAKLNQIEFQNKKLILLCEKLEGDLKGRSMKLEEALRMNRELEEERQRMKKEQDSYDYKMKKLKEELEVAHIIKEQNLADKVNYILGWKL